MESDAGCEEQGALTHKQSMCATETVTQKPQPPLNGATSFLLLGLHLLHITNFMYGIFYP